MTKMALVSDMLFLGMIDAKDVNYLMRKTKDHLTRIYETHVDLRKAYFKKAK